MAQLENFRLKVFRAVAERLSFHKAAEDLFLTPPAVTLQIKALENDIGVRLIDRTASQISLTRQGAVLLSYANKIARLVAEAEGSWEPARATSQETCHWEFRQRLHNTFPHGYSI